MREIRWKLRKNKIDKINFSVSIVKLVIVVVVIVAGVLLYKLLDNSDELVSEDIINSNYEDDNWKDNARAKKVKKDSFKRVFFWCAWRDSNPRS